MAEKRKIDLKARLGKKTVKGGPDVPPPMGIPKPVGVPVPPFGAKPGREGPKVDASDPYAAITAEDAAPQEQTIKLEMSQEVVEAQKKGRLKVVALALVTCVIGAFIGYTFGGRIEANKGAKAAVQGSKELLKKVDEANTVVEQLADVLKEATAKLKDNKYPEEAVQKLGGIDLPFTGADLYAKGMGRYQKDTQVLLITYTAAIQSANDQKGRVHRFLGAKKTVTDYLAQKHTPKVRWCTYIVNGPHGPWGVMTQVPEPFLSTSKEKTKDKDGKEKDYTWPDTFKIKDGNQTHELKRYVSRDPMGSQPKVVPIDPTTQEDVCPSDVIGRLKREVYDLELVLRGDPTPGREKQGLIQIGENLADALRKIGQAG